MDPLYLQAMMHGEHVTKRSTPLKNLQEKDRFEIALEKQIDDYVDAMEFEEDPNHKNLLSPTQRREKVKMEMKTAAKMQELLNHLNAAIKLILSKESTNLPSEMSDKLIADFTAALAKIKNTNPNEPDANLYTIIEISKESLEAIAVVAINKFSQGLYSDCLSLFTLLSVLIPGYAEYWFRLGIAAHKLNNIELAQKAYETASQLDSKLIGAKLFNAECYLQRHLAPEAEAELTAAKEIVGQYKNDIDKIWLDLLPKIENLVLVAKG